MQKPAQLRAIQSASGAEANAAGRPPKETASAARNVSEATADSGTSGLPRGRLGFLPIEWRRSLVIFVACSILLMWAFRSEIDGAVEVWTSSRTFGHAFFIFPVTLFLFYRLRHRLARLRPKVCPWAMALIAGGMLVWTIGDLANVMVVKQLAFIAIWQSLFLLVLGWQATLVSLFPLGFLYLLVPFGLSVIPPLQDITASIVVALLRFSGVPVFLEGYRIETPTASFLVAEACSGVRYLMVSFSLGVLAAHLFFRSWARRMLFVALSIIVPIIANGLRAYGIVMVAHLGNFDFAFDLDHVVYGFVFLSVVTLCLLGLGAVLRDGNHVLMSDPLDAAAGNQVTDTAGRMAIGQAGCALVAMATVLSAQAWAEAAKAAPPLLNVVLHAPSLESSWILDSDPPTWSPSFRRPDAELQQGYRRGSERVDLHVGYYAYQRDGAEVVSDLNTMTSRSDVKVLGAREMDIRIANVSLPVNEHVILYSGRPLLVWHWYQFGSDTTNSRLVGKLLEMKAIATGGERAAAIVAVSAEVLENVDDTAALLHSFLQESLGKYGALYQIALPPISATTATPDSSGQVGGASNP